MKFVGRISKVAFLLLTLTTVAVAWTNGEFLGSVFRDGIAYNPVSVTIKEKQ